MELSTRVKQGIYSTTDHLVIPISKLLNELIIFHKLGMYTQCHYCTVTLRLLDVLAQGLI